VELNSELMKAAQAW